MSLKKDLISGSLCAAIGLLFLLGGREYEVGQTADMGPGYFPLLLSILLLLLSLGIFTNALVLYRHRRGSVPASIGLIATRPVICIIAATLIFSLGIAGFPRLGIPPAGLLLSVLVTTIIGSLAATNVKLKEVLATALVLSIGCSVLFIYFLHLPFRMIPVI